MARIKPKENAVNTVAIVVIVALVCGLIAGAIAYSKTQRGGSFVTFFIFGTLFPLIGIVIAALSKAPPKPAGWYQDPWNQQAIRWHDGRDWTPHTDAVR